MIIAFPHKPSPIGGPGSFQLLLEKKLLSESHTIVYAGEDYTKNPDVVLVVGGTRKLLWLIKLKMNGTKIIHRLDGKNWQQSINNDGFYITFKSRAVNLLITVIKVFLADAIIYQSNFVLSIWNTTKKLNNNNYVIYNSVDIDEFRPVKKDLNNKPHFTIICVEGTVNGLPALDILRSIKSFSVDVYGNVSREIFRIFKQKTQNNINFKGPVSRTCIKEKLAGFKIFLNLETNPACPNSVIEALSAGVPVVGFDSGSLKELVGDAGIILPYGKGNPWKLESPDTKEIEFAIIKIKNNYKYYSKRARLRAKRLFSLDTMYLKYKKILFDL